MNERAGLWFQAAFIFFWAVVCLLYAFALLDGPVFVPRWLLFACGLVFLLVALRLMSVATDGDDRQSTLGALLIIWIGPIALLLLSGSLVTPRLCRGTHRV